MRYFTLLTAMIKISENFQFSIERFTTIHYEDGSGLKFVYTLDYSSEFYCQLDKNGKVVRHKKIK